MGLRRPGTVGTWGECENIERTTRVVPWPAPAISSWSIWSWRMSSTRQVCLTHIPWVLQGACPIKVLYLQLYLPVILSCQSTVLPMYSLTETLLDRRVPAGSIVSVLLLQWQIVKSCLPDEQTWPTSLKSREAYWLGLLPKEKAIVVFVAKAFYRQHRSGKISLLVRWRKRRCVFFIEFPLPGFALLLGLIRGSLE